LVRRLAREAARVRGKIKQGDAVHVPVHARSEIGLPLRQRVGQSDRAVGDEMGEHVAGEGLGARADARDRVAVGRWAAWSGAFAEAAHRDLAVSERADDDGRHFGVEDEDLPGELDHLVEQRIGARSTCARATARDQDHGNDGDPQQPARNAMSHHAAVSSR
jgi:hypothetical protein